MGHPDPSHPVLPAEKVEPHGRGEGVGAEGRGRWRAGGGVAEDAVDAADGGDGGRVADALSQQLLADLPGEDGRRLLLQVQDLADHLGCGHLLKVRNIYHGMHKQLAGRSEQPHFRDLANMNSQQRQLWSHKPS